MTPDERYDAYCKKVADVYAARTLVRLNAKEGKDTPEWIEQLALTETAVEFRLPRKRRRFFRWRL